jgi:hypothetical protein
VSFEKGQALAEEYGMDFYETSSKDDISTRFHFSYSDFHIPDTEFYRCNSNVSKRGKITKS